MLPTTDGAMLSHNPLDLDFPLRPLLLLPLTRLSLGTHDTATPVTSGLLVLLEEALLDGRDDLGEVGLVFGADFGDCEGGGGLVTM